MQMTPFYKRVFIKVKAKNGTKHFDSNKYASLKNTPI